MSTVKTNTNRTWKENTWLWKQGKKFIAIKYEPEIEPKHESQI